MWDSNAFSADVCVFLESEVLSVCWDVANKGETVSVTHYQDFPYYRFSSLFPENTRVILSKDKTKIVGIEIT